MDDVLAPNGGPETSGPVQADRDKSGRFVPGNSGNPKGRPLGSRHEALKLLDQMGEDNAKDIMDTLVQKAKGGDVRAIEVLFTRMWPARKGRPVKFDLGKLETAKDAAEAAGAVLREVADGRLSPEEGAAIADLLAAHRDATHLAEMAEKVEHLESILRARR